MDIESRFKSSRLIGPLAHVDDNNNNNNNNIGHPFQSSQGGNFVLAFGSGSNFNWKSGTKRVDAWKEGWGGSRCPMIRNGTFTPKLFSWFEPTCRFSGQGTRQVYWRLWGRSTHSVCGGQVLPARAQASTSTSQFFPTNPANS